MAAISTTTAAASPRRRIRLREGTPSDLPDIVRVHFDAFRAGVISRVMYPNGVSEDARAKFGSSITFPSPPPTAAAAAAAAGGGDQGDEEAHFVVVAELVPEGEGKAELVAFATWVLCRRQLPEEKWNVPVPKPTVEMVGEGTRLDVFDEVLGDMRRMGQKMIRGGKGMYLHLLACEPNYRRLGAGSALVKWGLDLADKEGLDTRLAASPAGYPLYRKHGFEDIAVRDLQVSKWGAVRAEDEDWGHANGVAVGGPADPGAYRSVWMKRVPRVAAAATGVAASVGAQA